MGGGAWEKGVEVMHHGTLTQLCGRLWTLNVLNLLLLITLVLQIALGGACLLGGHD